MAQIKQAQRTPCYGCWVLVDNEPRNLPRVQVNIHVSIIDNVSRTVLSQTFINSSDQPIREASYTFPLYDGVSVTGFTCAIGNRVIKGVVKERQKAQSEFNAAKVEGKAAALFRQSLCSSDVFMTTVGNIPAGGKATVTITYLGELKHDAEIDGLRLTIPTHIAPRYGADAMINCDTEIQEEGISIVVDTEMPQGAAIKSVQSPSHPITVSIGKVSTDTDVSSDLSLRKASATLSQNSCLLEKDFIIGIAATNIGEPCAFVELHPTIPHQRALMTTLVPKFNLPSEKHEIVFICDRSGSMHSHIPNLISTLRIFLKSLPIGIEFNICSFGSEYRFLWPKSRIYDEGSLQEAEEYVDSFAADYGGTEMYRPMAATFAQRNKATNLEVFLLTDGAISDQDRLFALINENMRENGNKIRAFSLGIGSGASTSLVEGIARAGNGFAQTVQDNEKMEKKVVRMLKGALSPHINKYSLSVKYEAGDVEDDDGFVLIESVMDSLHLDVVERNSDPTTAEEAPTISLFGRNADCDTATGDRSGNSGDEFAHLPVVPSLRYLQTPSKIPALYPFNRTTVYVLFSDSTPQKTIKSIILNGNSQHGPLSLEIPVAVLPTGSTTIHQLAARKEIIELDEGRGWLASAEGNDGTLLSEDYGDDLPELQKREAVRLGETFQVTGKWTSFVAVEEPLHGESSSPKRHGEQVNSSSGHGDEPQVQLVTRSVINHQALLGLAGPHDEDLIDYSDEECDISCSPSSDVESETNPPARRSVRRNRPAHLFDIEAEVDDEDEAEDEDDSRPEPKNKRLKLSSPEVDLSNKLQALVSLQSFAGNWLWSTSLEKVLELTYEDVLKWEIPPMVAAHTIMEDILATVCAITFLKKKFGPDKESWEMLVGKAESWLQGQIGDDIDSLKKGVSTRF
ncbi:unnamed protein product [Clonostachys rosea]|uniref:VIT domain-containing protein n=1 Tax=Bionectria ochroleuca TaxID=29856 RepID=A0ABY6UA79_BIOOC|nr:unnamed protein product [Clonostachys rosea]